MTDIRAAIHLATVKAMRLYITRATKTQDAYLRHMWQDAREYFTGEQDAFQFIDSFVAEIDNQLTRAWNEGAREAGVDPRDMDDPDLVILQDKIENEREYILGLAGDIDQARADGLTPAEFKQRFYSRVEMWANRYKETVNDAKLYFGSLDKYEWQLGATEQHCSTCYRLNGVVATGEEWDESGYRPQSPPNDKLECGGWKCDCSLVPTKRRRTRGGIPDVSTKSLKYSDDQPRDEAGRWTDGGGGSGGIVAYSPRVQSIYGGIPEKIRELAPPPEVIEESLGTTRFQFGTIYIDADSSEKRTSVEFAHEYAHYIDYKNDLSSSPEFQKVISESVQRSLSIEEPEIPPSSGDKDFWKYQTYARTGATVTALTQGEKGWMGHSREYLQVGDRASREVFALGFEAYVNYDPSYFKAFPEMKSYFKQLAGE